MANIPTYYRCGICKTRNAFVKEAYFHYSSEFLWRHWFIRCRRCNVWKQVREGLEVFRGAEVEAAALTFKDLPQPGASRRIAEAIGRLQDLDPDVQVEVRAEETARFRRMRPYLIPRSAAARAGFHVIEDDEPEEE